MQTIWTRIWTLVTDSISLDDKRYANCDTTLYSVIAAGHPVKMNLRHKSNEITR